MIKKLITLFKLGRKVAKSDILNIVSKFQEPPVAIKILFKILSKERLSFLVSVIIVKGKLNKNVNQYNNLLSCFLSYFLSNSEL